MPKQPKEKKRGPGQPPKPPEHKRRKYGVSLSPSEERAARECAGAATLTEAVRIMTARMQAQATP